jgi:hypothetical protein
LLNHPANFADPSRFFQQGLILVLGVWESRSDGPAKQPTPCPRETAVEASARGGASFSSLAEFSCTNLTRLVYYFYEMFHSQYRAYLLLPRLPWSGDKQAQGSDVPR